MKSYSESIQRLKDYGDLVSLTDGISRAVYELDALDRARTRDAQAVHLARNVLLLAECRKAARNVKAEASDPRARFALAELDKLQATVDQEIKRLILAGGGVEINRLGLTAWARRTVRAADAKRPKPTSAPKAKTTRTTAPRPRAKTAALSDRQRGQIERAEKLLRAAKTATADRRSAYLDQAARAMKAAAARR